MAAYCSLATSSATLARSTAPAPWNAAPNVRVEIDSRQNHAVCPVCHSEYDVFSLGGHPVAGEKLPEELRAEAIQSRLQAAPAHTC